MKRKDVHIVDVLDVFDIGDRDGWRCHLCGGPVDPDVPASTRLGPTIDHLVPISLGGTDSLSNVKLAHRSCNCSRGNRPIGAVECPAA